MKISPFHHPQKGQSLLEIAVALGLVALIITILTITTLNGLKNSQFAKNQLLASSYAQQALELVKVMRQRDCPIQLTNGTIYRWYDTSTGQPLIWNANADTTFNASDPNNPNSFTANSTTCQLIQNNSGEILENGAFTRRTKLEWISAGVLRVTTTIIWTDFSGIHETKNASLITNY